VRLARFLASLAFACSAIAPALAADETDSASPFIFARSALAPAAARGWVVLLPGEDELGFNAVQAHYEKVALLLNANGFDTLIVPYEDAYDEDVDGETDSDGDRIAAVTLRAVHWMQRGHAETAEAPGAIIAWADGAQGLWSLAKSGPAYPLPTLTAAVAFYPSFGNDAGYDSRLPVLVQAGGQDGRIHTLRHAIGYHAAGSVEPELEIYDDAKYAFDIETFTTPKTVRSMPVIGTPATFAYNAVAARAAEQKMLTFLKARLEAPE